MKGNKEEYQSVSDEEDTGCRSVGGPSLNHDLDCYYEKQDVEA